MHQIIVWKEREPRDEAKVAYVVCGVHTVLYKLQGEFRELNGLLKE